MFGFIPGQKCPGDGCENTLSYGQALCTACARREAQERAAEALYANTGLRSLVEYLRKWAAFEDIYGPN